MRRMIFALLIFLAIGPVAGTHQRFHETDLESQRIVAHRLIYAAGETGMLRFIEGWRLSSPNSMFGGFSALAVPAPGRFLLVSDGGYLTRLTLGEEGRVSRASIALLATPDGKARRKSQSDVEAMAVDPASGRAWVALEGLNRIWRLDAAMTRVEAQRDLPAPDWPSNRGPEAMARLADGRFLIFSEDADDDPRGREALLYRGDPTRAGKPPLRFFYDSDGKGLVSDAASLPDGRVLLVHRRLGLSPVFTTILAVVDPAEIRAGGVIRSQSIGSIPDALAENYEGAAIVTERGRTFVWLVADDNFNSWQRSLLVKFELAGLTSRKPASKKAAR